ncbi:hypothetical protein M407DRAFT_214458 [Tulasnella calospora MUT 4182]|uniref:Uncharacterized protein n=1 Tax=Tulasnella calospora MUT 4182 TaxID=1051891 RepID=A0A0C3KQ94_9AGAM|nr:hypothetical protein M407DRAFT_214458 [Tulasnella calospora MUT 4182]
MSRSANNHPHRGVDVTLLNLDEALAAVVGHPLWDMFNDYGIITSMLLCVEHIVASGSGSIGLEKQFSVLGSCEAALRTVKPQDHYIERIRRIRIDALTAIKELLPGPEERRAYMPSSIFESFRIYFQMLLSLDMKTNHRLRDERFDILDTFGPRIRQFWSYSPDYWEDSYDTRWCDVTGELRVKRDAARQTFNSYVSTVDEGFCQMHDDVRLVRDPEISWCKFRDGPPSKCIAATYSLPPDKRSDEYSTYDSESGES